MTDLSRRSALQCALAAAGTLPLLADKAAASTLGSAADGTNGVELTAMWSSFCQELDKLGKVLLRPAVPHNALDQAEGIRYLTRLLRGGLEMTVEASNPDFPRFYQLSNETMKIGADNPDNIYLTATVSATRSYRITGKRGTVPYLGFATKANRYHIDGTMASTGELDAKTMHIEPDGSFEIIVSATRQGKNWLPMAADSTMFLVRQTFLDKKTEIPAELHIEAIGMHARPAPITPDFMRAALADATKFVAGTANTFADWTEMFMKRPNELLPWDQNFFQKAGGDPNIFYLHGYWALADDEAWVIETRIPKCRFWNFQLDNWWMESLDYANVPNVWTNGKKAKLNADGTLTLVVATKDPGFGNWIDTTGHSSGTALLRWIGADEHPLPTAKIVKL